MVAIDIILDFLADAAQNDRDYDADYAPEDAETHDRTNFAHVTFKLSRTVAIHCTLVGTLTHGHHLELSIHHANQ